MKDPTQIVSRTGATRLVVQSRGWSGAATTSGGLVMKAHEQPLVDAQAMAAEIAEALIDTHSLRRGGRLYPDVARWAI
jgi:hypothetical protein